MTEFDERLRKIDARARLRAARLAKGEDDDEIKLPGEDEDPVGGATQALAGVLPALLALSEGHSAPTDWDDSEVYEIPNSSDVGKLLREKRRSNLPAAYNYSADVQEGEGGRAEEIKAADEASSGVSSDHRVVTRPRPIGQGS